MKTSTGRRCSATTKAGRPCLARPVRGSEPPLCAAHGGGRRPVGAPEGNENALKHGAYAKAAGPPDLTGRIHDLDRKIQGLSGYIDDLDEKKEREHYAELLALYGQLISRLGRLMRDQRAISGEAADGIAGAIAQALDELTTEMGIQP